MVVRGHPGYIPGFPVWMWILRRVFRILFAAGNIAHSILSVGLPARSLCPGSAWSVCSWIIHIFHTGECDHLPQVLSAELALGVRGHPVLLIILQNFTERERWFSGDKIVYV